MRRFLKGVVLGVIAALLVLCAGACENDQVKIKLDANGGTCAVHEIVAVKGGTAAPPPAAAKDGYLFTGWYIDKSGAESARWHFAEDKVKSDMTLYAGYVQEKNIVTVSYDLGVADGETVADSPADMRIAAGAKVPEPHAPKRDGYLFKGWYTDAACTNGWDFSENTALSDITLYAKWTKWCTVSYISNSPDIHLSDELVEEGAAFAGVAQPQQSGYVFIGWFTDADFREPYDRLSPIRGDTTLYGKWYEATAEEALVFERPRGGFVFISGVTDKFDGGILVVPETIDGAAVTAVLLSKRFAAEKIVLSKNVDQFSFYDVPAQGYEVSQFNRVFKSYKQCLYRDNSLIGASASRLIEPLPNTYFNVEGYALKLSGAPGNSVLYADKYYLVPDEFYEEYRTRAAINHAEDNVIPWSLVDFEKRRVTKDGTLVCYFGDEDSLVLGRGDGITAIGNKALPWIPDLTLGADITKLEGEVFLRYEDRRLAGKNISVTFEGDCPVLAGKKNPFASIASDRLSVYLDYDKLLDFTAKFNGMLELSVIQFKTDEEFLIVNNKLLRYYGTDTAVRLPDGLNGIYPYAFPASSNVRDIYFPAFTDTFTVAALGGYSSNSIYLSRHDTVNLYFPACVSAQSQPLYFPNMIVNFAQWSENKVNIYAEEKNGETAFYTDRYDWSDTYRVHTWEVGGNA